MWFKTKLWFQFVPRFGIWFRTGREGRSSFPVSEARASSECFSVSELGTGRLDRYRIDRIGSSTYAPAHPLSATPYADSASS